ncbi:MAG: hypothetical protein ACI9B8_002226 [Sulfitobacter sp.]|jgi:methyl-accepting chemotaxis protein
MSNTLLAQHVNKLTVLCLFVIAGLLMLTTYVWAQAKAADERLVERQFSLSLVNLSQKIDARIESMKLIAKTIASDKHIHDWVENGFAADQESLLVDKLGYLVNEYGLTSASFADKNTHKYWNHEGFLRVLQPETDTWYFAYLASGEADLISVYHDKNKNRVDVYVNHQQTAGNGLSGIATSFDGVLDMLNTSIFAKHGDIYLVDSSGEVQIQAESDNSGSTTGSTTESTNLQDLFSEQVVGGLLQPSSTDSVEFKLVGNSLVGARYIPNMNWYVVVNLANEG